MTIERVEVVIDGSWAEATLEKSLGDFAWRGWMFNWDTTPGEHELGCRATDAGGNGRIPSLSDLSLTTWEGSGSDQTEIRVCP